MSTSFTEKEDKYIIDNFLSMPIKTIAKNIGRSYTGVMGRLNANGLKIPLSIIEYRKKLGVYKKGNISFNKGKKQSEYMTAEAINRTAFTRFKKGNSPHNTSEKDGDISVRIDHANRSGKSYKWIRLSLGNWDLLHRQVWISANGNIPKGSCISFKDGNSLNCDLSNLTLITRKENMLNNSIQRYTPEMQQSLKLISRINKKIQKTNEQ